MHLSAPIFRLKRDAKRLARTEGIALSRALDRLAAKEGFQGWSHLAARHASKSPADSVITTLSPGDLVLIAARPGHGKTLLAFELLARAGTLNRRGALFTLDYHERDVADRFRDIGREPDRDLIVDASDDISADTIIARLKTLQMPTLFVVDYLQLLDQKRSNPPLDAQIKSLHGYVKKAGAIGVILSQIDRRFELSGRQMPDLSDLRLPNPVDVALFDKTCFLHDGVLGV